MGKGRIIWGGELSPAPAAETTEQPQFGSAQWIWYPEGNPAVAAPPGKHYFRRVVTLDAGSRIVSARLVMTADNDFVCYINGRRVGNGDNFNQGYTMNVASALKPGANLIAVDATNWTDSPNPAGLIGLLSIKLGDGRTIVVPTDQSWEASRKAAQGLELQYEGSPGLDRSRATWPARHGGPGARSGPGLRWRRFSPR